VKTTRTDKERFQIEKDLRELRARRAEGPVEKPWRPGEKPAGSRKGTP
jgi:hypothetical protein